MYSNVLHWLNCVHSRIGERFPFRSCSELELPHSISFPFARNVFGFRLCFFLGVFQLLESSNTL